MQWPEWEILEDEKYLRDCQNALSAIIKSMKSRINIEHDNYSLCHGIGGNCESLILAHETFRDAHYRSIAVDVGMYGIEKYGNQVSLVVFRQGKVMALCWAYQA
jgi:hypothetical protein